jgi:hypothetical protein
MDLVRVRGASSLVWCLLCTLLHSYNLQSLCTLLYTCNFQFNLVVLQTSLAESCFLICVVNVPSPKHSLIFLCLVADLICKHFNLLLSSINSDHCIHSGKLKYVSGERRLESGKFRFCWVILGEAVPISVGLYIFVILYLEMHPIPVDIITQFF